MHGGRGLIVLLFGMGIGAMLASAASAEESPQERTIIHPAPEPAAVEAVAVGPAAESAAARSASPSAAEDQAAPPTIRAAAAREADPGREIAPVLAGESPPGSGAEGFRHVSWSGDHLVIGAGTLIVILLVLVLVT
jgi:hypothetical protein